VRRCRKNLTLELLVINQRPFIKIKINCQYLA
jgi:hypothetical protein